MTAHLSVGASIAQLSGYGIARPPRGIVKIELREPGELAVLRPRSVRHDKPLSVVPWPRLNLAVNTMQFESGGNFVGGGIGIKGSLTGMAVAHGLNKLSRRRWEETFLHVTEMTPSGATRTATFSLPVFTPDRLLTEIAPALDKCADSFVNAVVNDEIAPFDNADDLTGTYAQIDQMLARNLLADSHARTLCAHISTPFLVALHERLIQGQISYDDAQHTERELTRLLAQRRITDEQAAPLRSLLAQIPSPVDRAQRNAERDRLIAQLADLRRTGAITEAELQAEAARLRLQ